MRFLLVALTFASVLTITQSLSLQDVSIASVSRNPVSRNQDRSLQHETMPRLAATNQRQSGRCWIFATFNMIRRHMINHYDNLDETFQFSYQYVFYHHMMDQAEQFLQSRPGQRVNQMGLLSDGGFWFRATDLMERYGVVPYQHYQDTLHGYSTREMNQIIDTKLREFAHQQINHDADVDQQVQWVRSLLDQLLGRPPASFQHEGSTVTPLEYYRKFVRTVYNPDHYMMVMNVPTHQYGTEMTVAGKRIRNVDPTEFRDLAVKMIANNHAPYFACDVMKYLDAQHKLMDPDAFTLNQTLSTTFGLSKLDEMMYGISHPTHAMTLIGATPGKGFLVENSWGEALNRLWMSQEWWDRYSYRLVVHRDLLPQNYLVQCSAVEATGWGFEPVGSV